MSGTNASLTTIKSVLEELYIADRNIPDMIMRSNPLLAMMPKKTTGGSQHRHVHVKFARPQGRSMSFAKAQGNFTPSKRTAFDVTWVSNYQVGGIDGDAIDDAKGNETILIDEVKCEVDGMIDNMKDDLAMGLFRNQGGARAVIDATATVASATLILSNPSDIVNFEVGMVIGAASTDGTSGSLRTGTAVIDSLDRDAGTIHTAGGNWSTQITSLATGDYLFVDGDFGARMAGLDAWCPATAPGSTLFFNCDRSADPVRLGGVRYTGTNMPIEQAIINGAARVQRHKKGVSINLGVLNPVRFADLEISLENRKRMVEVKGSDIAAHIGFNALLLATPTGDIPVISDPSCQSDTCWLLKKESWCLESVGDLVRLIDEDGNSMLRQTTNDGYEMRIKSRSNLECDEPGSNCRITLST